MWLKPGTVCDRNKLDLIELPSVAGRWLPGSLELLCLLLRQGQVVIPVPVATTQLKGYHGVKYASQIDGSSPRPCWQAN